MRRAPEALREAQLAMKEKYPDPLYWGAFICQGDPGPLSQEISNACWKFAKKRGDDEIRPCV